MGPRSAGFDEIEAGYAQQIAEEEHDAQYAETEDEDEEDEESSGTETADEDEFALAEREYLSEMRSGMHIAEEDEVGI